MRHLCNREIKVEVKELCTGISKLTVHVFSIPVVLNLFHFTFSVSTKLNILGAQTRARGPKLARNDLISHGPSCHVR